VSSLVTVLALCLSAAGEPDGAAASPEAGAKPYRPRAVLHRVTQRIGEARERARSLGRQTLNRLEVVLDTPLVECVVLPAGVVASILTGSPMHLAHV
jgi:hypothetical protein